jgi:hypothetical protein
MAVGRRIEVEIIGKIEIIEITGTTEITGEIKKITEKAGITSKNDSEMIRISFINLLISLIR